MEREFMEKAVSLAKESIEKGGGPFGCVIVKEGKIVAQGSNCVTLNCDPTAHAEVVAIRNACSNLGTYFLEGCEVYTSCEPCPMCLGALYWAHVDKIYYAASRKDAARGGFDDDFIYKEINLTPSLRSIPALSVADCGGEQVFDLWLSKVDRKEY